MINSLMRRIGLTTATPPADDETHATAEIDNAVIDSSRALDALNSLVAAGRRADDRLRSSIDRLKLSVADPADVMARIAQHRRPLQIFTGHCRPTNPEQS